MPQSSVAPSRSESDHADERSPERPVASAFVLPQEDWSRWSIHADDEWTTLTTGAPVPEQGWKIHCASSVGHGQRVLDLVARFCHERSAAFKYVPTRRRLAWRNSKAAPGAAAAKFITLYPRAPDLEEWLCVLHERLQGTEAPGILGDLRWRDGPLHVRHGGFRPRLVLGPDGCPTPAVVGPSGRLEPDVRGVVFDPPEWVELPRFLTVELDAQRAADPGPLAAYDVESVLSSTAAGGTYRARRRNDRAAVVLKEARPFITVASGDALERLAHEGRMLDHLATMDGVVTKSGSFQVGGHSFLVLDAVEGDTLNRSLYSRNPLVSPDSTAEQRLAYRDRALGLLAQVSETVRRLHRTGVTHGDLHPGNVMVDAEDRAILLDFEAASHDTDVVSEQSLIGVHGYAAPATVRGPARDHYSVAAMTLNAFIPLSFLHGLDPTLVPVHVEAARQAFFLDAGLCAELSTDLDVWPAEGAAAVLVGGDDPLSAPGACVLPEDLVAAVRSVVRGDVLTGPPGPAAARPVESGTTVRTPHGDGTGALQVLSAIGAATDDERASLTRWPLDVSTTRGVCGGMASQVVLAGTWRLPGADPRSAQLAKAASETVDLGVRDGLAGIGLAMIADHARNPSRQTRRSLDEVSRRLETECVPTPRWRAGLLDGLAGIAAFHVARSRTAHGRAGEHLAKARGLLGTALEQCAVTSDGRLEVRDGPRSLPSFGSGSAGLGIALLLYLEEADDEAFEHALPGIERACSAELVVHAGLADGRAGMMLFLAELARAGRASGSVGSAVERHLRCLRWHAVASREGVTYPDRELSGPSASLLHGASGVLVGLDAALRATAGGERLESLPDYLFLRGGHR
jgi:hypothetical protein